ncbi:MAG: nuclear transport factor 2 family protein [Chlorobi bacterium]|nr:nuclear transport factor 2 family protein [Chlorobiota bacterium]
MPLKIADNTKPEINFSEKELEVWKVIKANLINILSGNADAYMAYLHENFSGWSCDEILPVQKSSILSEIKALKKEQRKISFRLLPFSILVEENTAVVHYVYSVKTIGEDEKEIEREVKLTDVLIKQKGKWFLLGDHVGIKKSVNDSKKDNGHEK